MAEGERIQRAIRAAMGRTEDARTLSALARKARIQRATLYAWFDGQRPEAETQERVAAALGVRRADLWPTDEEPPADPLLVALNRQTAILERTCAQLADNAAAQEQGLSDLAQAIADVLHIVEARLGVAEDGDAAPVASSRRGRS